MLLVLLPLFSVTKTQTMLLNIIAVDKWWYCKSRRRAGPLCVFTAVVPPLLTYSTGRLLPQYCLIILHCFKYFTVGCINSTCTITNWVSSNTNRQKHWTGPCNVCKTAHIVKMFHLKPEFMPHDISARTLITVLRSLSVWLGTLGCSWLQGRTHFHTFLCGLWIFSSCLCGFSPCTTASSRSPKPCS